jgi:hypothetical protein
MAMKQLVKDRLEPAKEKSPGSVPKKPWEKPILEEVSGRVMAQPYIRFT